MKTYKSIKSFKKYSLLIVICYSSILHAQTASFSQVMQELVQIQQKFRAAPSGYISCTVTYLFSRESMPTRYLDSLPGFYKAYSNSRYSKIGNTEAIENDTAVLAIYNDNQTMVASAPMANNKSDQRLFLNSVDSAFVASNVTGVTITKQSGQNIMSFKFNDSSHYYSCDVTYDATTHVPQTIAYILRTTKLVQAGQPSDGGLITIRFSNYSTNSFDTSLLNINRYVSLNTGAKTGLGTYSGYGFYQKGAIGSKQ